MNTCAVKLLIFAGSDGDGGHLGDASGARPELLKAAVYEQHRIELEVTYRRLYVHAEGWEDYFEKTLEATRPDIIIVCVNGVSWSFKTVPIRLRKWFGSGAGKWAERRQQQIDRGAKSSRPREYLARGVHWTVRRVIPAGTYMSRASAEARWLQVIDRVAREEEAFVVIGSKVDQRGELLKAWPRLNEEIARHNDVLRRRADERHLVCFDREAILRELGEELAFLEDRVHRQEPFHVLMAARMLDAIRPALEGHTAPVG